MKGRKELEEVYNLGALINDEIPRFVHEVNETSSGTELWKSLLQGEKKIGVQI